MRTGPHVSILQLLKTFAAADTVHGVWVGGQVGTMHAWECPFSCRVPGFSVTTYVCRIFGAW
jgi:hypothetical protein